MSSSKERTGEMEMRDVLIALHAAGGAIAFIAGVLAVTPSRSREQKRRLFAVFAVALTVMILNLAAVVVVSWSTLISSERIVFPALLVLALYLGVRARAAFRVLSDHPDGRDRDYLEHMGFVLISLFEGFVIVASIDVRAPGWLVVLMAATGIMVGIGLLSRLEGRAARFRPPRPAIRPH